MEYKDQHILRLIHFDNLVDTHRKYFYPLSMIRFTKGNLLTANAEVST